MIFTVISFASFFPPYNQGYVYFSRDQYKSEAIKFHRKCDRRGVFPSPSNVAPTDFGSWPELQRDAILANGAKQDL